MNISAARLRWLYIGRPEWWTGVGFSVFGKIILLVLFLLWRYEHKFAANAVEVVAKVTGKEKRKEMGGKKGNTPVTIPYLNFTFRDDAGQQHSGFANVPADSWERAKAGNDLTIEYDRTNPAKNRPAGHFSTLPPIAYVIGGGFGLLFATVGLLQVGYLLCQSWRRVRLIQTGVPAVGVVTGVIEDQSIALEPFLSSLKAGRLDFRSAWVPAGTFRVAYQFMDPSGTTLEGRGPRQPYSLAYRWNPGEEMLVLYDPRNPSRNEADLFETRFR
jgi:hypothetical protein